MTKIHVLVSFHLTVSDQLSYAFTGGSIVAVDAEIAALAVARGVATFADFEEDDLYDELDRQNEDAIDLEQTIRDEIDEARK